MNKSVFHFLCVDDEEDDAFFFTRALNNHSKQAVAHWVSSGQIAMEYLMDDSKPLPNLIICDINMPAMTGFEFLKWIRASPFRKIPVVMLSGSTLPVDVDTAFDLGANAYIGKSVLTSERGKVVERIVEFWCETSTLPSIRKEMLGLTRNSSDSLSGFTHFPSPAAPPRMATPVGTRAED